VLQEGQRYEDVVAGIVSDSHLHEFSDKTGP
jgi:hypothetical protein